MAGLDPRELLYQASRRLIVVRLSDVPVPLVYQVRRPTGADLLGLGVLDLLGAAAVEQVKSEINDAMQLALTAPERRTEVAAQMAERVEGLRAHAARAFLTDPEARASAVRRCAAWVVSGVEAAGIGLPTAPNGPAPANTQPSAICVPLEDGNPPVYLRPLRFVEGDAGPDPAVQSLDTLSPDAVLTLGSLIQTAYLPTKEVRPF